VVVRSAGDIQAVVAGPAIERIGAAVRLQLIVAIAADQRVAVADRLQDIVPGPAREPIGVCGRSDKVIAVTAVGDAPCRARTATDTDPVVTGIAGLA
jgi:hypothetical protein